MLKPERKRNRNKLTRTQQRRNAEIRAEARHATRTPTQSADVQPAINGSIYHDIFDPRELFDPSIEYESLTQRQHLQLFGGKPAEVITLRGRQLNSSTGLMVETSEQKTLSRTDTTLLVRGKTTEKIGRFTRVTSKTKRRKIEIEVNEPPTQTDETKTSRMGNSSGRYTPDPDSILPTLD